MLAHLIHHLLVLFTYNHGDRHVLLHWYRSQLPGMPRNWYPGYVRYLIHTYPHAMWGCLHLLNHHGTLVQLQHTCP